MGWEVAPRSLCDLLLRLKRDYQLPPIYITENGAAYDDAPDADGAVRDDAAGVPPLYVDYVFAALVSRVRMQCRRRCNLLALDTFARPGSNRAGRIHQLSGNLSGVVDIANRLALHQGGGA